MKSSKIVPSNVKLFFQVPATDGKTTYHSSSCLYLNSASNNISNASSCESKDEKANELTDLKKCDEFDENSVDKKTLNSNGESHIQDIKPIQSQYEPQGS